MGSWRSTTFSAPMALKESSCTRFKAEANWAVSVSLLETSVCLGGFDASRGVGDVCTALCLPTQRLSDEGSMAVESVLFSGFLMMDSSVFFVVLCVGFLESEPPDMPGGFSKLSQGYSA